MNRAERSREHYAWTWALYMTALAAFLTACSIPAVDDFAPSDGTYVNPVLERDFPDPAALHAPDGWFYVYATQSSASGKVINIQVARSLDLVRWRHLGDALPVKPGWAAGKQNFWAPHVIYDASERRYFMYYSAEPDHAGGKCLGVATSAEPSGPFTDSGRPLVCGEGLEHIDPMAFDDPRTGKRLLYWGSGATPIKVQELSADRLGFLPGSVWRHVVFPDARREYGALIEAPWVTYRNGMYYLFYSGDRCCTRNPRYAIMVARSRDALGPFEPFRGATGDGSSIILERNHAWSAPGHNSVVADGEGNDWMLYHAMRPAQAAEKEVSGPPGVRMMLLDRIEYRDGWPRVSGDRPSISRQQAPVLNGGRF